LRANRCTAPAVHHVGAESFAGDLERRLGAGRGLVEKVDLRAPAQGGALLLDLARNADRLFGEIEQGNDFVATQALDAKQVAAVEGGGRRR